MGRCSPGGEGRGGRRGERPARSAWVRLARAGPGPLPTFTGRPAGARERCPAGAQQASKPGRGGRIAAPEPSETRGATPSDRSILSPSAWLRMAWASRFLRCYGWPMTTPTRRAEPAARVTEIGEQDLHLFNEGTHLHAYDRLGAHLGQQGGVEGTYFAVWAPNAE